jgi:hypothetical protein
VLLWDDVVAMILDYWTERSKIPSRCLLVQVLGSIGRISDDSLTRRSERVGWCGVSPKYYSVEDEHDIEVVEPVIGYRSPLAGGLDGDACSAALGSRDSGGIPLGGPQWAGVN